MERQFEKTLDVLTMSHIILKKLSIYEEIAIGDRVFAGLKDIQEDVDVSIEIDCIRNEFYDENIIDRDGLHIARIWERYPCFDSEDALYERRTYQNYYFSMKEFTGQRLKEILSKSKRGIDACLVNEEMPSEFAPAIYYRGEGEWMYLALATE